MNFKVNYKSIDYLKIGRKTFHIGIFLLPSAFSFSAFLLLISIFFSSFNYKNIIKQKWNYPFFAVAILMLIRNIFSEINFLVPNRPSFLEEVSWPDLLNWIPLIWAFSCFQMYLITKKDRDNKKSL